MRYEDDELIHGGKWSEEAKQRVRDARRRGIKLMDINAQELRKRMAKRAAEVRRNALRLSRQSGKGINRFGKQAGRTINGIGKGINRFSKQAQKALNRFGKQAGKFNRDLKRKAYNSVGQKKAVNYLLSKGGSRLTSKLVKDKQLNSIAKKSREVNSRIASEKSKIKKASKSGMDAYKRGRDIGIHTNNINQNKKWLKNLKRQAKNREADITSWGDIAGMHVNDATRKLGKLGKKAGKGLNKLGKEIGKGVNKLDKAATKKINEFAYNQDGKKVTKKEQRTKSKIVGDTYKRLEKERRKSKNASQHFYKDEKGRLKFNLTTKKHDDKAFDKYRDKEMAKAHRRAEESTNPKERYKNVGDFANKTVGGFADKVKKKVSKQINDYRGRQSDKEADREFDNMSRKSSRAIKTKYGKVYVDSSGKNGSRMDSYSGANFKSKAHKEKAIKEAKKIVERDRNKERNAYRNAKRKEKGLGEYKEPKTKKKKNSIEKKLNKMFKGSTESKYSFKVKKDVSKKK